MATPHTTPATSRRPRPPAPASGAGEIPAALVDQLERLIGPASALFDQKPRRPGGNKWKATNPGQSTTPAREHYKAHLSGAATHAATLIRDGMTSLGNADDDHGGIEQAQRTVDDLADRLGLFVFAIARRSLDDTGAPRHDGSRLFLPLDQPGPAPVVKAAMAAILAPSGYSTSEIMRRAELPFGRSMWTPAGDEYGQLIRPGMPPVRIENAAHGLRLIAMYQPNDRDYVLSLAPEAPQALPLPRRATEQPSGAKRITGGHRDVVAAFEQRYTVHDVLINHRRIGPVNYCCNCTAHPNGDRSPSIGIDNAKGLAYFNAPACRYHNQNRAYTAFSLFQYLDHGGDYKAAVNAARDLLNMPFQAIPAARPAATRRAPTLQPATVDQHPASWSAAAVASIQARAQADSRIAGRAAGDVLAVILASAGEGGICSLSWGRLAAAAQCSRITARRAVDMLTTAGYIGRHANATERGAYAPNVLELRPQAMTGDMLIVQNLKHEQSIYTIQEGSIMPQSGALDLIDLALEYAGDDTPALDLSFFNSSSGDVPEDPAGDMPADDWDSLLAQAPAAPGEAPAPVETITPPPPAPQGALQPAGTDLPWGINAPAYAILAADPYWLLDHQAAQAAPPAPAAPAAPLVDPPAALLNQAADLIDAGRYGDYEVFKAQHPGYCWADCTDLRASYRRWRGELIERRPQAARRDREQWSMAA